MNKKLKKELKAQRRADRLSGKEPRPALQPGDVYVTGGGCWHDSWCAAVNGVWLSGSEKVTVVTMEEAKRRNKIAPCLWCRMAQGVTEQERHLDAIASAGRTGPM